MPKSDTPPLTQKQEQILQGAMRIFLTSGYATTSMDRVASEAGVSKQTIYSHFGDKKGLFTALIERVTIGRFRDLICCEPHLREPQALLRDLATTYLQKVAGNPEYLALLRVIVSESERFPELAKLFSETVIIRGRTLLVEYFNARPELNITDAEAVAHIFFGSLVSHVMFQDIMHGRELMPMESDRLIHTLIDLILIRSHPISDHVSHQIKD